MKLTDQQVNSIIAKLNEVSSGGIVCPICHNRQWAINDIVVESREFQHGNLILGGNSALVPYVTITCRNCANTLFLNAIQLGIVNPNQEKNDNINANGE
ncbi:MAG: hypothetical protein II934_02385 [Prevotella sp.]|nr:hypothetical protein [Prevotella sp.]